MLARSVGIQSLLLCLAIVRNAVVGIDTPDRPIQISKPEVLKIPSVPRSSNVSETLPSSLGSRILKRTTVLIPEKQRNPVNATLVKKITEDIDEDDTTVITTEISSLTALESSSIKTMDFRPSTHIGEIHDYESRKSTTGPFNNVQHVKFENSVNIEDSDIGRVPAPLSPSTPLSFFDGSERARNRVKSYDTDGRYGVAVPVEFYVSPQVSPEQQQTEEIVENEEDNNEHDNNNYNQLVPMLMGHEGVVTIEHPATHYYADVSAKPMTLTNPVYPAMITDHKPHQLHRYEPSMYNAPAIHVKPSKFHGEVVTSMPVVHLQHYEYAAPAGGGEDIEKPEFIRHHPGSYQIVSQPTHTDGVAKPETVLLISSHRETAITRTRKFPYKFHYPPNVGQHDSQYYYVSEGRHSYPVKERRISPWKKIIHLIGAFLPFGLLLAVLKPNVLRVGGPNSTRPNDVFSTLRDLPVEHKNGRRENSLDNVQEDMCEDKSICELIVSGSKPQANLLQHLLWNFTYRSSDDEAKKHGLHEIFAAVKQKNCSYIAC